MEPIFRQKEKEIISAAQYESLKRLLQAYTLYRV